MKKIVLILMVSSLFIGCATKGGTTLGCSKKSCETKSCSKKSCKTKSCSKSCCANKTPKNAELQKEKNTNKEPNNN